MVYTYYMVCVTCVLYEQPMPARPPKKLKRRHTSPNDHIPPPVVLKNWIRQKYLDPDPLSCCIIFRMICPCQIAKSAKIIFAYNLIHFTSTKNNNNFTCET